MKCDDCGKRIGRFGRKGPYKYGNKTLCLMCLHFAQIKKVIDESWGNRCIFCKKKPVSWGTAIIVHLEERYMKCIFCGARWKWSYWEETGKIADFVLVRSSSSGIGKQFLDQNYKLDDWVTIGRKLLETVKAGGKDLFGMIKLSYAKGEITKEEYKDLTALLE